MITKETILADVNSDLRRSETDIDRQIISTLQEISQRGYFLRDEISGELDTDGIINIPNLIAVEYLSISDEEYLPVPRSEYQSRKGYTVIGTSVYVYPAEVSSYQVIYIKEHPATADEIEYGDNFLECIELGTMYRICRKYKQWEDAKNYKDLFDMEVSRLASIHLPLTKKYSSDYLYRI